MNEPTLPPKPQGQLKGLRPGLKLPDMPSDSLFAGVLRQLARSSKLTVRSCAPGEVVFAEGERDDTMYVIQSGQVAIIKGNYEDPIILAQRGAGELLGEMALLDDQPHSASVVALGAVELLCIHRTDFQELLQTDPALVMKVMSTLSERLRMADDIRTAISRLEQKLSRELEFAGEIQAKLLPTAIPDVPGWDIAASLTPARQTSGDYYDVISLTNGQIALLVADVADKGAAAALVMAVSRTLLHTFSLYHPAEPARIFAMANERLLTDTATDLFVTAFYAVLDPTSGRLTYVNAGHNPIYVFRAGGEVEILGRTGVPLGAFEDLTWEQPTVQFAPGDTLVVYTDGLVEARTAEHEMFGKERLEATIKANLGCSAEEMRTALLADVQAFVGDEPQFDDITLMIAVRR